MKDRTTPEADMPVTAREPAPDEPRPAGVPAPVQEVVHMTARDPRTGQLVRNETSEPKKDE